MARVFLRRTLRGFEPATDSDVETLRRFKIGDVMRADVVKPRSYQFHKLAFALLTLTFNSQNRYAKFEHFRAAVQIAAGHVEELITLDGEVYLVPKSISYEALDQVEFERVFAEMMRVCADEFLAGTKHSILRAEVERYAAEQSAA